MSDSSGPALRSQDMVFTLFGDYLLDREAPIWTGSLITLLGQLGLSPMAVRTVLSRMSRKGWLAVEKRGTRSWHALTRKGRRLLEAGRERLYRPPAAAAWDGQWSIITYSVPEERRPRRDALRNRLTALGCGSMAAGVWLSPHDVTAEVRAIAEELRLPRHIEVFRGRHLGFAEAAVLASQCWNLSALNERYARFLSRWRRDFERCRSCGLTGARAGIHQPCTDPSDCFRRRFLLVHEFRGFAMEDPHLPAELLPDGWHGAAAARLFETYHDSLAGAADRYVAEVCRQGDAPARAA